MKKKIRVIVLMGGRSPEYDVSLVSGREVVKHLDKRRYETFPLIISRDGEQWRFVSSDNFLKSQIKIEKKPSERSAARSKLKSQDNYLNLPLELKNKKPDVVFIAMHGPYGEDGVIQGLLESVGLPYTGAGVASSAIGMNKSLFKKIMVAERIPTADFLIFERKCPKETVWKKFSPPVVVKPSSQGSSVGVSIVRRKNDLAGVVKKAFNYGQRIVIEKYLNGMEVTCGVIGNENLFALPVVEIVPKKEFFDYEAKYQNGMSEEIVPARISSTLTKKVQETAIRVYKAIGCRGFGRIDMIIYQNIPHVLEINTIPGLTPNSLLPKEAAAAGISYPKLLDKIIELALAEC